MLENTNRSFLGGPVRVAILLGVICSLLLLASSVASAQIPQRRVKRPEPIQPVSKVDDKDRAREFDRITAQPPNSIRVQVRYKKEYGYKDDTNAFGHVGPISCGAFSVSAGPDPSVRLEYLIGIENPGKMRESDGFYVCDFLVTDLPLNAPIKVGVDLADRRSLPFEAWKGGSQAQPPPGQQRTIIIVGGRVSGINGVDDGIFASRIRAQDKTRTVTLTEAEPGATQIFEMVYAPTPLMPPGQPVPQRRRLPVTPH